MSLHSHCIAFIALLHTLLNTLLALHCTALHCTALPCPTLTTTCRRLIMIVKLLHIEIVEDVYPHCRTQDSERAPRQVSDPYPRLFAVVTYSNPSLYL
ncbi:hypothetical protein EJ02DRAFT_456461 [Clathrospora elynae]|uniref:Secreted protein n=1 Tax=Clathrospora elynae TaxID=706981 RepID=A0A6A5SJV3_9PLEO|nr:hypothetical protein EJ02DRAFT_456461 [Clathrospora elynae]